MQPELITIPASDLLDVGAWGAACMLLGINPWIIAEGKFDSSDKVTLTIEQAKELGVA